MLAGASPLWPLAELAGEVSGHSCLFLLCWITVLLLAWLQSYHMKTRQPCISQNEKGIQHLKSRSPMTCLCWTAAVTAAEQGAPSLLYIRPGLAGERSMDAA